MKKNVNVYYLAAVLEPLVVDGSEFRQIEPNDERQIRKLIRRVIRPYFERFDVDSQQITRNTLAYYLAFGGVEFEDVFEFAQAAIAPPACARNFFVWLWEELFHGEEFSDSDADQFLVQNDIHGPNNIKLV